VSQFSEATDVALDAACGISHPLKFYLAEKSKEVHAVDIDRRILSKEEIIRAIIDDFGEECIKNVKDYWFQKIKFQNSSITDLPYENNSFDKIYCISVLEHLPDFFNTHPSIRKIHLPFLKKDIEKAMKEFNRVIKPSGLLFLTFDYPDINLDYLTEVIQASNFIYCRKVNYTIPKDTLFWEEKNVRFFRAALKKRI
jgi:ubiquinone/menaquinone biosynthesis C-methylase UbiE